MPEESLDKPQAPTDYEFGAGLEPQTRSDLLGPCYLSATNPVVDQPPISLQELREEMMAMAERVPPIFLADGGTALRWFAGQLGRVRGLRIIRLPRPDRLLTPKQLAEKLSISMRAVYDHAQEWPFTKKVGGSIRFSEHEVEQWLRRGGDES